MTVFKGFLTITKRNMNLVILYLVIFLTIALTVDKMLAPPQAGMFEQVSLTIGIIDEDEGTLAKGLSKYLENWHTIQELPDDPGIIQDRLFYRDVYYIVRIPEDFEQKCLKENKQLEITKVPDSNSGIYVDQQINTFFNSIRTLTAGGFSLDEAIEKTNKYASSDTKVSLADKNSNGGNMPGHAFMFQYMPYILISILCYTLSTIMIAFNQSDVRKRMLCSAVTSRSMNLQFVLGYAVIGTVVWLICTLMPIGLYGKEFLQDPHLPYYLLNSLIMTLVSLAIAFFIGIFVHRAELVSAVVNVVSLGLSFLCGVFVSLDVMGKGIKTAAHFLPVYWYEENNNLLGYNASLSSSQLADLMRNYGIQLLFAAALICTAFAFRYHQTHSDA